MRRRGRFGRALKSCAPGTKVLAHAVGIASKRDVPPVELDTFHVQADREAHPHLGDPRFGCIHPPRTNAHIEETDGKPGGPDRAHLDVEVPGDGLRGYATADHGPEGQNHRQHCHQEPGSEK
jgi:hypothetical protein